MNRPAYSFQAGPLCRGHDRRTSRPYGFEHGRAVGGLEYPPVAMNFDQSRLISVRSIYEMCLRSRD